MFVMVQVQQAAAKQSLSVQHCAAQLAVITGLSCLFSPKSVGY
jgi:hypothetical protein